MKQLNVKQKVFCSIILGFFFSVVSFAQGAYEITGKVTSDDGMPLPGVNVLVVGTPNGTATDFDGNYSLTASSGQSLEFNYIGFATQTIALTGQKTINVTLAQDAQSLADVVVVGYGTRKKSHLTGAIAKIGGDDVAALQVTRVDDALAGKLAGVRIQNVSGQPGAAPRIQVRAGASITGDGDPLIVVDGFPISGDLSTVNPNDIESIEVLKDASSAAIYGSRGANGVIMVTTKKGKVGKPSFNYNTYVSINSAYQGDNDIYPSIGEWVKNIEDNRDIWVDGDALNNDDYDTLFDARLQMYKDIDELGAAVDYQDNVFRNGITKNHDFSVRGGSDSMKYFASVGYLDAEAAVQNSDFKRYSARMNMNFDLSSKLKAGISFNGIVSEREIFPIQLHDAIRTQPFLPKFHTAETIALVQEYNDLVTGLGYSGASSRDGSSLEDLQPGDYAHEWHFNANRTSGDDRVAVGAGLSTDNGAQAKLDGREDTEDVTFGNINGFLSYDIIDGLTLKTTLGGDYEQTSKLKRTESFGDRDGIGDTFNDIDEEVDKSWVNETTLNFSRVIAEKHDIDVIIGATWIKEYFESLSVDGDDFISDDLNLYSSFGTVAVSNDERVAVRKSGFFRANYAYDDRYLASFSIRRDGYSGFGINTKWGNFPAASIGWNIHNEAFWESIHDVVSTFKLRASYGKLGSTEGIDEYESQSLLDAVQVNLGGGTVTGFSPSNVANPDLSWQINEEQNFGIDLGFMNNKIRLGVDYFISTTEDMLLNQENTIYTGFQTGFVNQGKLESSGLEIELGATPVATENFKWDVSANFSTINVEVVDYNNGDPTDVEPDSRLPIFRTQVGGGISEFWGYKSTGETVNPFYQLYPGYPIGGVSSHTYVEDISGPDGEPDGVIDENDEVYLGSNIPDFTWGFSSNMNYKDFDLSFVLQGSHGAEVANGDPFYYGTYWRGGQSSLYGGVDSDKQALLQDKRNTDIFIQDASFVALRNVTFGYTFNKGTVIESSPLSSVRIYFAGSNLLYFWADEYTSFNPEGVNFEDDTPLQYGGQRGATPIARTYTLGVNFNF